MKCNCGSKIFWQQDSLKTEPWELSKLRLHTCALCGLKYLGSTHEGSWKLYDLKLPETVAVIKAYNDKKLIPTRR